MRERLKFEKPYAFRNTVLSFAFFFSQSQSFLSQSFDQRFSLNTAEKSSKKRKSVDVEESSFKKSKFNSQNADKIKRNKKINNQTTSFYIHDDSSFDNRIFDCLMISSAGRAIRDFWSILKLLKILHDAIKAHKSLYTKRKILHKNISKNNIIITNSKKTDDFKSMLIDEYFVKKIDNDRSDARHQTCIMKFMTIEVLQRIAHIYRHDFELFFYVLLWMYACRTWKKNLNASRKIDSKKTFYQSSIRAASIILRTQNKITCTSINLRTFWRNFHRFLIMSNLCVKRYEVSFFFTKMVWSLKLRQIHQRSYMISLLKLLITL